MINYVFRELIWHVVYFLKKNSHSHNALLEATLTAPEQKAAMSHTVTGSTTK